MMQMNLPMRLRLRNTEQTCGFQSGGQVGGMVWESGLSRYKLLYTEWINKILLYSTGNYIQYLV